MCLDNIEHKNVARAMWLDLLMKDIKYVSYMCLY